MKNLLPHLFCVFALVSCFHGPSGHEESKEVWGWQSAGLIPDPEKVLKDGSGIYRVTHVGNRLFVMDNRRKEDDSRAFQMFTAMQGSKHWDTLMLPSGVYPYTWVADTESIYIGADTLGELWRYTPLTSTWEQLLKYNSEYAIEGLGFYKGRLVASLASSVLMHWPVLIQDGKGGWTNTMEESDTSRFSFMEAVENEGKLYAASWNQSIWSYTDAEGWIRIKGEKIIYPDFVSEQVAARALTSFNRDLYVGYLNGGGVFKYTPERWTRIDSCEKWLYDGGATVVDLCNTPLITHSLVTWNGHLIAAGLDGSNPIVWGGPSEPKAWRKIGKDTWCVNVECFGGQTSDMTVLNDTLYAAAWDGLWKYPLDQMDSSIKLDSGYPKPQSSSSAAGK